MLTVGTWNVSGLDYGSTREILIRRLKRNACDFYCIQELQRRDTAASFRPLAPNSGYSYMAAPKNANQKNVGFMYKDDLLDRFPGMVISVVTAHNRVAHFKVRIRQPDVVLHFIVLHGHHQGKYTDDMAEYEKVYFQYKKIRAAIPSSMRHVVVTAGDFNTAFCREIRDSFKYEFQVSKSVYKRAKHQRHRRVHVGPNHTTPEKMNMAQDYLSVMSGSKGDCFPAARFPRPWKQMITYKHELVKNQPEKRQFYMLDHIAVTKKHKKMVTNYETRERDFKGSDHALVVMKLNINWITDRYKRLGPLWDRHKEFPLWNWGGLPWYNLVMKRADETCKTMVGEKMNPQAHQSIRGIEAINRILDPPNEDPNRPVDELWSELLARVKKQSDEIFKNPRFDVGKLRGRVGTRGQRPPKNIHDRANDDQIMADNPAKLYIKLLWREKFMVDDYEARQMQQLLLEKYIFWMSRKEQRDSMMTTVTAPCPSGTVQELMKLGRQPMVPNRARFRVRCVITRKIRKRIDFMKNLIIKRRDQIKGHRKKYHTQGYLMWFTSHVLGSLNARDIQDVYKPRRDERQQSGQPEQLEIRDDKGKRQTDPKVVAEIIKETVKTKLEQEMIQVSEARVAAYKATPTSYNPEPEVVQKVDERIETREIERVVDTVNDAGSRDLKANTVRQLKITILPMLAIIIKNIWDSRGQKYVTDWEITHKLSLYKGKRKDKYDAKSYRNITINSFGKKVLVKILLSRISAEINKGIPDIHLGFLKGRGTTDGMAIVRQAIQVANLRGTPLCISFVDLKSAFPSVNRELLIAVIRRSGMLTEFTCDLIERFYKHTPTRFKVGKEYSETYTTTRGVEEGCALSPLLFVIYIQAVLDRIKELIPQELKNDMGIGIGCQQALDATGKPLLGGKIYTKKILLEELTVKDLWTLAYADDIVFFHSTPQKAAATMPFVREAFRDFGLDFDLSDHRKCQYMALNQPEQLNGEIYVYRIHGQQLHKTAKYKYLGTQILETASMTEELDHRLLLVRLAAAKEQHVLTCPQISKKAKMSIIHMTCYTQLSFGSQSWHLSEPQYKKIDVQQKIIIRRALSLKYYHHTSNDKLYKTSNVVEWSLRLRSHLLVHHAQNISRSDVPGSVRYQMLLLKKFRNLTEQGFGLVQYATDDDHTDSFHRNATTRMRTLHAALEKFEIPATHILTGEPLHYLDRLTMFGTTYPLKEVLEPEMGTFQVAEVRRKTKQFLFDRRLERSTGYKVAKELRYFCILHRPPVDEDDVPVKPEFRDSETLVIYTDGSYKDFTEKGKEEDKRAGWSFNLLHVTSRGTLKPLMTPKCGKVGTDVEDLTTYRGATHPSNNTGELQAIYEAIDYVISQGGNLRQYKKILICSDSQTSIGALEGSARVARNWLLIRKTQAKLHALITSIPQCKVEFMYIKAHQNAAEQDKWNEWADRFAKGSIGVENLVNHQRHYKRSFPSVGMDVPRRGSRDRAPRRNASM